MSMSDFWRSNPWALRIVAEAYGDRIRDTQEIHAGFTSAIMTVCQQPSKNPKRWTPQKLIGSRRGVRDGGSFNSAEEMRAHLAELQNQPKDDNVW